MTDICRCGEYATCEVCLAQHSRVVRGGSWGATLPVPMPMDQVRGAPFDEALPATVNPLGTPDPLQKLRELERDVHTIRELLSLRVLHESRVGALQRALEDLEVRVKAERIRVLPCARCRGAGRLPHCRDDYCGETKVCPVCNGTKTAGPV